MGENVMDFFAPCFSFAAVVASLLSSLASLRSKAPPPPSIADVRPPLSSSPSLNSPNRQ